MYPGSNISSSESYLTLRKEKSWYAVVKLSIIWKVDRSNEMNWDFFQVLTVSVLLQEFILTKRLEKNVNLNKNTWYLQ